MNKFQYYFLLLGKHLKQVSDIIHPRFLSMVAPKVASQDVKDPKTGIIMLNMGGPTTTDEVHNYLLRIMTDTDMIQLPAQRSVSSNDKE